MQIMKQQFIFIFFLFFNSFLFAQNEIQQNLLFPPQEMEIQKDSSTIAIAQILELKEILKKSRTENSAGKWKINTADKSFQIHFQIDSGLKNHDAYQLKVNDLGVSLCAKNNNALKYGKQTLWQILEYAELHQNLPEIEILDWADIERRGFMLDVSRDKIPTMESLYHLIDQLSEWRYNELQLYTEHTFAYRNHKKVWENASPLTAEEIQKLNTYARERGIDLVPNQNSFGHMENWLKHDEYLDLAECETDCQTIWGARKRTALAPTNPKSLELMKELYDELLPNFSSKYFNIGGDETVELGLGKSKALSDKIGKGRVYLDFLEKLNEEVLKNGKQTMFWGDIVLNHPELIKEIPENMIALVWGYDAGYPFDENLKKFQNAKLDFYVVPGTSTWRSEIGRNHNAFTNLKEAVLAAKKYGAKGYLVTEWGDYGHFQPKSVSYPAMVLGANYAWNYQDQTLDNLEFLLNHYVFKDSSENTAKALLTLGDAYLKADIPAGNANAFHLMIRRYKWTMQGNYQTKHLNEKGLLAAEKEIDRGLEILTKAELTSYDAEIIVRELKQAAELARFGIHLGIARLKTNDKSTAQIPAKKKEELANQLEEIITSHQEIWTVRNREGGLQDSAEKLQNVVDYLRKQMC